MLEPRSLPALALVLMGALVSACQPTVITMGGVAGDGGPEAEAASVEDSQPDSAGADHEGVPADVADRDLPPAVAPPGSQVFALDVLHEVVIEVAPENLSKVLNGSGSERVPCTITYDGVKLPMSGVRRKGFFSSVSTTKPALSVAFDEFVKDQKLDGLDKLALNNAKQDKTFLKEHLGYEVYRMAGLPAPRTAHAQVTMNGKVYGLYVVKEAIDKTFLSAAFGRSYRNGNLYEGTIVDFVTDPLKVELKNEAEEMRKRDDVIALSTLIKQSPDAQFEAMVGAALRLDLTMTVFAIDLIVSHWDSYEYYSNNYYIYDNPQDGKFLFIPHGMDRLFGVPADYPYGEPYPLQDPFASLDAVEKGAHKGQLAVRIFNNPALMKKLRAEVARVIRQVWDVARLDARIDQAAAVITRATNAPADLASFKSYLPKVHDYVGKRKAFVESVTP
jgi:spore coat protein H